PALLGQEVQDDLDVRILKLHADRRRLGKAHETVTDLDDLAMSLLRDDLQRVAPLNPVELDRDLLFHLRVRDDVHADSAADEAKDLIEILVLHVERDVLVAFGCGGLRPGKIVLDIRALCGLFLLTRRFFLSKARSAGKREQKAQGSTAKIRPPARR